MSAFSNFYFRAWRTALLAGCLAIISYLLYFRNLGSLVPGYSASELHALATAADWHHIFNNPVNAPFSIPVWLLTAVFHQGAVAARMVAAVFGIGAAVVFYAIVRPAHGYRIALLATLLFATSAGLLHSARLGTGSVLQMGILLIIATFLYIQRLPIHKRTMFGYWSVALTAILWYVPGMIWFELFGVLVMLGSFRRQLAHTPTRYLVGWTATFLALLAPLVYAVVRDWHVALDVLGLPHSVPALTTIGTNVLHTILSLGIHSYGSPAMWVGHAPLLNAIELLLGLLGLLYYLWHTRNSRSVFLIGATILALVLISLGGTVAWACVVPLLYCFVAQGIKQLLDRWLTVFPRNPIAKFTGVGLVCIMLLFSVLYQVRSYFVAWPHTAATRHEFRHKE